MSAPSHSPPPYSLTPPSAPPSAAAPTRRTASSPHLRTPPAFQFYASSSRGLAPRRAHPAPTDTSEDEERSAASASDDGVIYTVPTSGFSVSGTLRARVLSKDKGRTDDGIRVRLITTAPGVLGAGETETEGEDSPRNLPTARITRPALAHLTLQFPPSISALLPSLYSLSSLLSIVPAIFGTLYNIVHLLTESTLARRVEYFIAVLWSILTGWQCLQLTTGLLKRWRVYYSPLPTLIRLFALQAICWPATHLTLQLLAHERRPALCWAVVGTTTCCSRVVQLWVTSNIAPADPAADAGKWTLGRRRRWDWGAVGRACALPAGVVYCVMAWAEMLRREWERGACACA